MDDAELQAIRQKRMAELQRTHGGGNGGSGNGSGGASPSFGGMPRGGGAQEDEEKKSQMEEARRTMLLQILDNNARERLSRIRMVKEEKARAVEDLLIRMAQSNQLRAQVTEQQLIDLLDQINQQEPSESQKRVTIHRRRYDDDSEDEYDL